GLVIKIRFAVGGGEAFQSRGKFVERNQHWILPKVSKSHAYVVGVMECLGRDGAGFELRDQFLIRHRLFQCAGHDFLFGFRAASFSRKRWLARESNSSP